MLSENANTLGPFLVNRYGDRYLYEVNRDTFNQVGSETIFLKYWGQHFAQPNYLHILVGSDSGLIISWLKKRSLPSGSRVLIVELPEVLKKLRIEGLLEGLPECIRVVGFEGLDATAKEFRFESYVYQNATRVRGTYAVIDAHFEGYHELLTVVNEWFKHSVDQIGTVIGTSGFIVRQLENLGENRIAANCLKGLFRGQSAVVLGGGPSLDDILPWIQEHKGRLIIIAVSRISRQLLAAKLLPHFVVSIDPQDISFDVSREMLRMHETAIFTHAYHVCPQLPAQWAGRSLYLGDLFPWPCALNNNNVPAHGPTVTNAALGLAMAMECSQIVLAGVDLCFSPSGMTHAGGSNESILGPYLKGAAHRVQTNGGWMAQTNGGFRNAMDVLEQQAGLARELGLRVINPAAAAARIAHVDYLPVTEIVLQSHLSCSPVEKVLSLLPADDSEARFQSYKAVAAELNRACMNLKKIGRLAREALRCNIGLFGLSGKKPDFRYKGRMDKIEKRLNHDFGDFIPLIKQFGMRSFVKTIRPNVAATWSNEEIERAGRMYYEAYRDSAAGLLSLVKRAQERIASRMEEETPRPNIGRLVEQWRKDGQPGRAVLWKQRRGDLVATLTEGELKDLSQMETDFDRLMAQSETRQISLLREGRSLKGINARVRHLFKRKDKEGLHSILEGLSTHPDQDGAQPLTHLVQGFVCELDGAREEALQHYQQLIGDRFEPISEDALKRIAVISLETGKIEFALMALECLSHGAVIFKPQYAGLLQTLGRLQDAADVYTDYLEAVPHDLVALLRLGQLYRSMGHEDAARQVFQMVLAQDSANLSAQALLRGN